MCFFTINARQLNKTLPPPCHLSPPGPAPAPARPRRGSPPLPLPLPAPAMAPRRRRGARASTAAQRTKSLAECLQVCGLDPDAEPFAGCANLEDEFKRIKQGFFRTAKTAHPDKGGSAEAFRELRAAFQALKDLAAGGRIATFQPAAGRKKAPKKAPKKRKGRKKAKAEPEEEEEPEAPPFETSFNVHFDGFEDLPIPSWDAYEEAEGEEVPTVRRGPRPGPLPFPRPPRPAPFPPLAPSGGPDRPRSRRPRPAVPHGVRGDRALDVRHAPAGREEQAQAVRVPDVRFRGQPADAEGGWPGHPADRHREGHGAGGEPRRDVRVVRPLRARDLLARAPEGVGEAPRPAGGRGHLPQGDAGDGRGDLHGLQRAGDRRPAGHRGAHDGQGQLDPARRGRQVQPQAQARGRRGARPGGPREEGEEGAEEGQGDRGGGPDGEGQVRNQEEARQEGEEGAEAGQGDRGGGPDSDGLRGDRDREPEEGAVRDPAAGRGERRRGRPRPQREAPDGRDDGPLPGDRRRRGSQPGQGQDQGDARELRGQGHRLCVGQDGHPAVREGAGDVEGDQGPQLGQVHPDGAGRPLRGPAREQGAGDDRVLQGQPVAGGSRAAAGAAAAAEPGGGN